MKSFNLSLGRPRRWTYFVALLAALMLLGGLFELKHSGPENLFNDPAGRAAVLDSWKAGNLIVLVRHAERCDHSQVPCLSTPDGITARAQDVASRLGHDFENIGLADADIMSSPLTRAEQTAEFMFGSSEPRQDWLFNCRGSMLKKVLEHKRIHHNLILVTHSECIKDLASSMGTPLHGNPEYASSMFLASTESSKAKMLGYLDANQWNIGK